MKILSLDFGSTFSSILITTLAASCISTAFAAPLPSLGDSRSAAVYNDFTINLHKRAQANEHGKITEVDDGYVRFHIVAWMRQKKIDTSKFVVYDKPTYDGKEPGPGPKMASDWVQDHDGYNWEGSMFNEEFYQDAKLLTSNREQLLRCGRQVMGDTTTGNLLLFNGGDDSNPNSVWKTQQRQRVHARMVGKNGNPPKSHGIMHMEDNAKRLGQVKGIEGPSGAVTSVKEYATHIPNDKSTTSRSRRKTLGKVQHEPQDLMMSGALPEEEPDAPKGPGKLDGPSTPGIVKSPNAPNKPAKPKSRNPLVNLFRGSPGG